MFKIKYIIFFLVIGGFSSCYYDVESELYPSTNSSCVTTDISFSKDVLGIMASNCLGCHNDVSKQGGISLSNHAEVLKYVTDKTFLGSIKHDNGYEPMPKSAAKMSACSISKIESWINAGAPNN